MHTLFVDPEALTPYELDQWLARGWYRMGQSMFTARFVVFEDQLRSAVWTRLPLQGYTFRKSLRRVLNRVDGQFRTEIGPLVVDAEREDLYQRYRAAARGDRSQNLTEFLFGDSDRDVFDTHEVRVWDGDQLVAFSWFDVGTVGLQSLIGVYEPALARQSLGFYTMLAEIRYGIARDLHWFYPGYVLPGDPSMDYKLRVGEVEFLDPEAQRWCPWAQFPGYALPTARLDHAMEEVGAALQALGVPARRRLVPWFDVAARQPALAACLAEPLVMECWPEREGPTRLMVSWDLDRRTFVLVRCLRAEARRLDRDGNLVETDPSLELWVVVERMHRRTRAADLAADVARASA